MVVGAVLTAGFHGVTSVPQAHAVATSGSDNFAIATGFVDDQIEGLYFLDFLTGDLRCAIVNRRNATFSAYFQYNVLADFPGVNDKPRFLLVTGLADLPRGRGATQIGRSLVYVAEATSGRIAAYAVPYNSTLLNAASPQTGTFIPIARGSFRDAFVRDQ
jgi:hypothetical protein